MPIGPHDPHLPTILRRPLVAWSLLSLTLVLLATLLLPSAERINPTQLTLVEAAHLEMAGRVLSDFQSDFSQGVSESLRQRLPRRCDGIVQPLWSWLVAFWHDPMDVGLTLQRSQWTLYGASLALLACVGVVGWRGFGLLPALWLMLFYAKGVVLPQLTSFGPAIAYQAAMWLLWLACLRCLRCNTLWSYGVIGASAALAWLLEDRLVFLLLGAFGIASSLRAIWGWVHEQLRPQAELSGWRWNHHLPGLLLCAACFALPCSARWIEASQWYGNSLHNLWDEARWLGSSGEAAQWLREQESRSGEQRPALQRLHLDSSRLLDDIPTSLKRLGNGARMLQEQLHLPLLLLAVLLPLLLPAWVATRSRSENHLKVVLQWHPETPSLMLFALGCSAASWLLCCWDAPVIPTPAHALLLPAATTLLWAIEGCVDRSNTRQRQLLWARDVLLSLGMMRALGLTQI